MGPVWREAALSGFLSVWRLANGIRNEMDAIPRFSIIIDEDETGFCKAYEKEAENPASFLAPTRGFEPPTYRLGGGRSILLSYVGLFPFNARVL